MTGTALDMAERLKTTSLKQMALDVYLANTTPLPKTLYLSDIMKLFAKIAKPDLPKDLAYEPIFNEDAPVLPRPQAQFLWVDGGANTVRYATSYHCRLSLDYGSGIALLGGGDDIKTKTSPIIFPTVLDYDTTYRAAVQAVNDWGVGEWRWTEFTTYDNPKGGSSSGTGTGSGTPTPHPKGILFWNCDVTSVSAGVIEHQPVCFWLFDLTSGQKSSQSVPAGDGSTPCGPNQSNAALTIPSSSFSITSGHNYRWAVVKPGDGQCLDPTDPNSSVTVVMTSGFTAGNDAPIPVNWTNAG